MVHDQFQQLNLGSQGAFNQEDPFAGFMYSAAQNYGGFYP